jgi:hypothetical protein
VCGWLLCCSSGVWGAVQPPNTAFRSGVWKVSTFRIPWGGACVTIHSGLAPSVISSPLLSPHLDFRDNPCKIQEQPFNLLVHQIWSLFFYYVFFYLKWFIKLVIFSILPLLYFLIFQIWSSFFLFLFIFFVLSHFLNWFYFAISPSLDFFSYQI